MNAASPRSFAPATLAALLALPSLLACTNAPPPLVPPLAPPPPVDAGAARPFADGGDVDPGPIAVTSSDPQWGSPVAPVTLVEFNGLACQPCARLHAASYKVRELYGPSQIHIVWKSYPIAIHKDARPAAVAAQRAFQLGGSPAFSIFVDLAFDNQHAFNSAQYQAWGTLAGVEAAAIVTPDEAAEAKVDADVALAKQLGLSEPPASFVNGIFVGGAQPIEKLTAVIDAQLAAAKAEVTAGTPAERVYGKLSRRNYVRPTPAAAAMPAEPGVPRAR